MDKVLSIAARTLAGVVVASVLAGLIAGNRPSTPQYTSFLDCYQRTGDPALCKMPSRE